ncbi:MAG: hypothetical protein V1685_05110 [Parcubacteria group bacterium]
METRTKQIPVVPLIILLLPAASFVISVLFVIITPTYIHRGVVIHTDQEAAGIMVLITLVTAAWAMHTASPLKPGPSPKAKHLWLWVLVVALEWISFIALVR